MIRWQQHLTVCVCNHQGYFSYPKLAQSEIGLILNSHQCWCAATVCVCVWVWVVDVVQHRYRPKKEKQAIKKKKKETRTWKKRKKSLDPVQVNVHGIFLPFSLSLSLSARLLFSFIEITNDAQRAAIIRDEGGSEKSKENTIATSKTKFVVPRKKKIDFFERRLNEKRNGNAANSTVSIQNQSRAIFCYQKTIVCRVLAVLDEKWIEMKTCEMKLSFFR